jgi:hypothetical protein
LLRPRVRLRLFSDALAYLSALEKPGSSWQSAGHFWIGNYPAASDFITHFACSHRFNVGHFCDKTIDAKIRRAEATGA